MNKEIEELVSKIIEAIEKVTKMPVPEDVIENIRIKCALLAKTPEIQVTSNPKEFDSHARMTKSFYQGSFGDTHREKTYTDVLYGDYQPGLSQIKDYPNNSNLSIEIHETSDFSMNKLQIALSTDNYDENLSVLVIYVPEAKEWDQTSFKKSIENEQKQALLKQLREKTKGKVPEEQLLILVDKFDFSNGIPDIKVISDPKLFDDTARESANVYSDSFENDNSLFVDVNTLYGNYQSGNDTVFEHRGYRSSYSESNTPSDFNLNEVQIVLVNNYQYRRFYNRETEKESSSIVIYLPEKEYEEQSYKKYREKQERTHSISEVKQLYTSYIPKNISPDFFKKRSLDNLSKLFGTENSVEKTSGREDSKGTEK